MYAGCGKTAAAATTTTTTKRTVSKNNLEKYAVCIPSIPSS